MTDVLKQFSPAAWRDIEFPITARDYGFSQQHASHKYIFRDNALIESLGRENPTYRYTIPFREDIAIGRYENLFTAVYPDFLAACQDRSEGILDDPFHGGIQCKCASLREIVDVGRRDGIDVEVEFIVAPSPSQLLEDLGTRISTRAGAEGMAGALDAEVALVDWQQELPPEPTLDPFSAIASIGDQIAAAGNRIGATMADVAFRAEKAADSVNRLRNPKLAPLAQQARRLAAAALDLADAPPELTRQIGDYIVPAEIGVIALAGRLRMSVEDFLKLNPGLPRTGRVPAGKRVRYFKR